MADMMEPVSERLEGSKSEKCGTQKFSAPGVAPVRMRDSEYSELTI